MTPDTTAQLTIDSLSKPKTLPIIGLPAADFWVLTLPGLAGLLVGMVLGWGLPTIGLCLAGLLVGSTLVYISPPYLTSASFLRVLSRHVRRPSHVANVTSASDPPSTSLFDRIEADE